MEDTSPATCEVQQALEDSAGQLYPTQVSQQVVGSSAVYGEEVYDERRQGNPVHPFLIPVGFDYELVEHFGIRFSRSGPNEHEPYQFHYDDPPQYHRPKEGGGHAEEAVELEHHEIDQAHLLVGQPCARSFQSRVPCDEHEPLSLDPTR